MKKVLVRMLSVSLATLIIVVSAVISASAVTGIKIKVADVSGDAGSVVSVPVTVTENSGVVAFKLKVTYDTKLEFTDVVDGGILGTAYHTSIVDGDSTKIDTSSDAFYLAWLDGTASSNFTATGTIATLKFKIPENSMKDAKYAVSVELEQPEDAVAFDFSDVPITIEAGSVTSLTGASFVYGDVNNDGRVNAVDVMILQRYLAGWYNDGFGNVTFIEAAADVQQKGTNKGKVNAADTMVLQRHNANISGYEDLPITA